MYRSWTQIMTMDIMTHATSGAVEDCMAGAYLLELGLVYWCVEHLDHLQVQLVHLLGQEYVGLLEEQEEQCMLVTKLRNIVDIIVRV